MTGNFQLSVERADEWADQSLWRWPMQIPVLPGITKAADIDRARQDGLTSACEGRERGVRCAYNRQHINRFPITLHKTLSLFRLRNYGCQIGTIYFFFVSYVKSTGQFFHGFLFSKWVWDGHSWRKVDVLIPGVSFFKHCHLSEPASIFEKYTVCFSEHFMALFVSVYSGEMWRAAGEVEVGESGRPHSYQAD